MHMQRNGPQAFGEWQHDHEVGGAGVVTVIGHDQHRATPRLLMASRRRHRIETGKPHLTRWGLVSLTRRGRFRVGAIGVGPDFAGGEAIAKPAIPDCPLLQLRPPRRSVLTLGGVGGVGCFQQMGAQALSQGLHGYRADEYAVLALLGDDEAAFAEPVAAPQRGRHDDGAALPNAARDRVPAMRGLGAHSHLLRVSDYLNI